MKISLHYKRKYLSKFSKQTLFEIWNENERNEVEHWNSFENPFDLSLDFETRISRLSSPLGVHCRRNFRVDK